MEQSTRLFRQEEERNRKLDIQLSLKEIDKIFDMDYTVLSQAVRRFENKVKKDNKAKNMIISVLELLKNRK
ncbi:MAG: hypothetical protein A2163_03155 [Actinobacteria bacterium RBG_13_35_12]|nr:MAG: hypothetical protein A2163_03155 [Actinobacteria bacterium RBG_13_35_12]